MMKVTKNNRAQYQAEWASLQGETFFGYAPKVQQRLAAHGISVTTKKIHNVVLGSVKDFQILRMILQVCSENKIDIHVSAQENFNLEKSSTI
jgi:hypothetical protein